MGAKAAPAHHDGRGSRVEHLIAAAWCATVAPERADRADLPGKRRALRWVAGALTRSGFPRATRLAMCGRPVAVCRDGDWAVSWAHKWCNDRACPACAARRSRELGASIRRAVNIRRDLGGALYFLTLTQPRVLGESAARAHARAEHAMQRLRKHPVWSAMVGGARIVEAVHSARGWHVHFHCIVEVQQHSTRAVPCAACDGSRVVVRKIGAAYRPRPCRSCNSSTHMGDGTMPVGLAELVRVWSSLVAGSTAAQCAVPLDDCNAGQLAKYITKLWDLDDAAARELFAAMAGKRILNTFGEWRARGRGDECNPLAPRAGLLLRGRRYDVHARRWWRGPLVADVEKMHPRSYVVFEGSTGAKLEGEATAKHAGAGSWRPALPIVRMTAGQYLRQLAADQRRCDEHGPAPPDTPTPGADMLATASGARGPWSMHARTLQRLKRRQLASRHVVVDVEGREPLASSGAMRTVRLEPGEAAPAKAAKREQSPWPEAFALWVRYDLRREVESGA